MADDSMLPGAAAASPLRSRQGPSFAVLLVAGVFVAAVVGLLAGAVWGLSGRNAAAPPVVGPAPAPSVPSPAPSQPEPSPSVTGPTGPSGFPPAPVTSVQTSDDWHVGTWRVTNTGGQVGMQATVTNRATQARSGSFRLYLYANGAPLATLQASVTDVPAGSPLPVTFTSTDQWGPGTKTMVFVAQ